MRNAVDQLARLGWLLALALLSVPLNGNAQALPDGAGKELVPQACTRCHLLRSVVVSRHTRQEWDNVVTDMIGRGASIMENEIDAIVEYLAKSSPKDTRSFNVNRATAKELVEALGLNAQEADALIRHRDQNGYYNNFKDGVRLGGATHPGI